MSPALSNPHLLHSIPLALLFGAGPLQAAHPVRVNIGATDSESVAQIAERVKTIHGGDVVRSIPQHRFLTVSVDADRVHELEMDPGLRSRARFIEEDQVMEIPEREEWLGRLSAGLPLAPQPDRADPGTDHVPGDPKYGNQWGPACIDAEAAWDYDPSDRRVIVAIIDTGIDLSHPDLKANINKDLDWDFVENDDRPKDDMGHGTHIAGIIAAQIDNGKGVAGLAQVQLVGIKAVNWLGVGFVSDIVAALYHAGDIGAHFVNMSLGFTSGAQSLHTAIQEVTAQGTLVIAAAGNSGNQKNTYPAAYDEVLGVSALDESCVQLASFSSYGIDNVDLAAPGNNIYSTLPDHPTWYNLLGLLPFDYGYLSGTSMACPMVVGVAAGYKAYDFSLSPAEIRDLLLRFADDLGDPVRFGSGRVDYFPFAD